MSLVSDLRVLASLAPRRDRARSHEERLEHFYRNQAGDYDAFRRRLLTGRESLIADLPLQAGLHWVEMGGGTGATLEFLGERIHDLASVTLVDLCRPLLEVARERIESRGWKNVETVCADVTTYEPVHPVDVVVFSYSLTMIPDWFAAIENALSMLRPGGLIGVVDFYVSRRHPAPEMCRHGLVTRVGWPAWFSLDNVFPSPDHLPMLLHKFEKLSLREWKAKVPYLPLVRVPAYRFVGRKPRS